MIWVSIIKRVDCEDLNKEIEDLHETLCKLP